MTAKKAPASPKPAANSNILTILTQEVEAIAALPSTELMRLANEAADLKKQSDAVKAKLDQALERRYSDRAKQKRAEEGKDTGTAHVEDNGVDITCDMPKKVEWDEEKLAGIHAKIAAAGDDPTEYIEVSYGVAEKKYTAWPESIRKVFEPARTVKTGKQSFKLAPVDADKAA